MKPPRYYFDHAATTPLAPAVKKAMIPWLDSGNASSLYAEGRRAKAAVDASREILSEALGCEFGEVLFTGSGTEAANMAIVGVVLANQDVSRKRVLVSAAEHHCVLHTRATVEALGYRFEIVPVDREARLDLEALNSILGPDVLLVSVMHANNEFGTINPIREISGYVHENGSMLHSDAVQTFAKFPWQVETLGVDISTISAHKLNGPKGVGAIYLRAGTRLKPLIQGGGQEREMRAGTENVAAIVGFGAAVQMGHTDDGSLAKARLAFLDQLAPVTPLVSVDLARTLPGHLHLRFPGIQAETLLIRLDRMGVSASSGSACSSGSMEPSHVMLAAGYSMDEAKEGVRFTFGPETSIEAATEGGAIVREAVQATRL